jgi:alpha-L-fucosidase
MRRLVRSLVLVALPLGVTLTAAEKTFIDYFQPTSIRSTLRTDVWGAPTVGPRDPANGLEDTTMKQWCYWDGQIIKAPDGKYHLFASRWDQAAGHRGWGGSKAVHAVSDNLYGPYVDKGLCWPDDEGGKGHNVTALVMPDGRYAVVVSETRPGDVFVSKSLDGPWEHLGKITVERGNYSERDAKLSNVSIMVRPDGDFMIVPRSGTIWISKTGILGPYKIVAPSAYGQIPGMQQRGIEDPVVWYSGGLYHIVANDFGQRKAIHLTSKDGITGWTLRGAAYDPTKGFVRYTDGTVNHWNKLERPGVYIENGHVAAVTLAVIDVPKNEEVGNDAHGSKVIVIPFDGAALDRDLAQADGRPVATEPTRGRRTAAGEAAAPRSTQPPRSRFGMGPPVTPEIVEQAAAAKTSAAPGPVQPTWESIKENYTTPEWFRDGKFGIFIHWGLYSVAAYHNEWYQKYIYGNEGIRDWHIQHYGPLDTHGYITLADQFATKFDPNAWAELFKRAGATYVIPTAEHHDWFSLWDSQVSPWNAKKLGPHRDLIGELAAAVRKEGLKFGVSNHSIEHYTFINQRPPAGMKSDLDDPKYADYYWINHTDENREKFLELWVAKNLELIDKYRPDMLWFDNGVNARVYDPIKLKVAAYYYNRAKEWGKQVSISTKDSAYLAGSIMDYERQSRAPKQLTDYVWQPDDPIGPTFGYTTANRGEDRSKDMEVSSATSLLQRMIQDISRNGNYLLNISPRGDGTIPENQQKVLLAMGDWLRTNGDAIYGTRPWTKSDEGRTYFTRKGDALYAITLEWPSSGELALTSVGTAIGKVTAVELLGHRGPLEFSQSADGLKIKFPAGKTGEHAYALKISGLKLE